MAKRLTCTCYPIGGLHGANCPKSKPRPPRPARGAQLREWHDRLSRWIDKAADLASDPDVSSTLFGQFLGLSTASAVIGGNPNRDQLCALARHVNYLVDVLNRHLVRLHAQARRTFVSKLATVARRRRWPVVTPPPAIAVWGAAVTCAGTTEVPRG